MKTHLIILLTIVTICCKAQTNEQELNPREFANKIKTLPDALILDVRTPEEFDKQHLDKAVNINWREAGFEDKITAYDKTRPVMVYCLVGGRSKQAADKLRAMGFTEVYEMKGGIVKWNAEGLSEPASKEWTGMSNEEYKAIVNSSPLVLVDFYAEWCGPCKQMEPYIKELKTEMSDIVNIMQIDADQNKSILTELKIDALPVFHLYKDHKLIWQHSGFISKEDLVDRLRKSK